MNFYNEIKNELINNETFKRVKDYSKNRNDLQTYYNVGKLLVEAQGGEERAKYGDKLIKEYSIKLFNDMGIKYSERNLRNMRQFYIVFKGENWNAMRTNLSWTHYRELISLKNIDKINYYINISIEQNLGYRELHKRIKTNEYERLSENTKNKLIKSQETHIEDYIKNPIIIKNYENHENITEKILKHLILEDLDSFMKELGEGFSYIENEYKIKLGNSYNYIDLLLFNIKYNCYVVVELKVTELKKEHIGQIQTYMNFIDKNLRTVNQNKTIGIIIVKKENRFILEYSSDERIFETTYMLI